MPIVVNAQVEVNKVIEDRLYQLEIHPYFTLFNPDKAAIILRAAHTVQAINWTGTGDWTYTANSTRRIIIQYSGEFEETGMRPDTQEAVIGATFVVTASLVLLLLAGAPHGGEYLQDVLAGQILWVTADQLVLAAVVSAGVLFLWWGFHDRLGGGLFYALFAIAVTVSVQLVGVYLVFASLILPALVAKRRGSLAGYLAGTLGYAIGLAASALLDLPAGPSAVCGLAAVSSMAALPRRHGY